MLGGATCLSGAHDIDRQFHGTVWSFAVLQPVPYDLYAAAGNEWVTD